jgi:hypothetical protein
MWKLKRSCDAVAGVSGIAAHAVEWAGARRVKRAILRASVVRRQVAKVWKMMAQHI